MFNNSNAIHKQLAGGSKKIHTAYCAGWRNTEPLFTKKTLFYGCKNVGKINKYQHTKKINKTRPYTIQIYLMMTSSTGSIFRVTGRLCGEFTGHRYISPTMASDAELWCFLWSAPELNDSVNNRDAGGLRRHRAHYDVIVIFVISRWVTTYSGLISVGVVFFTALFVVIYRESLDPGTAGLSLMYALQVNSSSIGHHWCTSHKKMHTRHRCALLY